MVVGESAGVNCAFGDFRPWFVQHADFTARILPNYGPLRIAAIGDIIVARHAGMNDAAHFWVARRKHFSPQEHSAGIDFDYLE